MRTKLTSTTQKICQRTLLLPVLAFVLVLYPSPSLLAQNLTDDIKQPNEVRVPPSFPGDQSMYVASHVKYRYEARQNKEEGTAVVRFVVELDGSLSHVEGIEGPKLLKGVLLEEVIRMVKEMPKWEPAIGHDGNPVRSWYTFPVRFKLD